MMELTVIKAEKSTNPLHSQQMDYDGPGFQNKYLCEDEGTNISISASVEIKPRMQEKVNYYIPQNIHNNSPDKGLSKFSESANSSAVKDR